MPQIGCKTCGKRRPKKSNEILVPIELPAATPSQAHIIKNNPVENFVQFDWKSMSKRI